MTSFPAYYGGLKASTPTFSVINNNILERPISVAAGLFMGHVVQRFVLPKKRRQGTSYETYEFVGHLALKTAIAGVLIDLAGPENAAFYGIGLFKGMHFGDEVETVLQLLEAERI